MILVAQLEYQFGNVSKSFSSIESCKARIKMYIVTIDIIALSTFSWIYLSLCKVIQNKNSLALPYD